MPRQTAALPPTGRGRSSIPFAGALATLRFPKDSYRIALFLLLVVSISRVHQNFGFIAAVRPALLLFLFATAYALSVPSSLRERPVLRDWLAKTTVALFAAACASALFGLSLGSAAKFILDDFSKTVVFTLILIAGIRAPRDLYMFVWAYVISCGILAWMALFVFGLQSDGGAMRLNNMHTYDANDLGVVLVVGLPLILLTASVAKGRGKTASFLILIGAGVSIARTGSRGAFLGLIVVGAVLLVVATQVSLVKRVLAVGVVFVTLIMAAPPGYWARMKTITKPTEDYNWQLKDGRKEVAKRGIGYLLQYPVFGVGIHNFSRAEGTISEKARYHVEGTGIRWTAAHNSYIEAAAELGFVGLSMWLALLIGGAVSAARLRRLLPRAWAMADPARRFVYLSTTYVPLSYLAFASTCAFVSFAYLTPLYVLVAFTVGLHECARQLLAEDSPAGLTATPVGAVSRFRTPVHAAAARRLR